MGWGEPHEPNVAVGTRQQVADATVALRVVGITRDNLALAALEAAGAIDRLRHLLSRLLRESASGERLAVHDEVRRQLDDLLGAHIRQEDTGSGRRR